ncbi:MAG: hypothetical protein JXR36_16175 [Bacteroidales bacterium]|nr:hypothetical protein [Bacteroidales bacterium]
MKTIININNYEAYWVDYLDGVLNSDQEDALMSFLEENPNIAGSLIDVEDYKLPNLDAEYPEKTKLLSFYQIDNLLIAKIEGTISLEDDKFITEKINSEVATKESYSIYKKTLLSPDNTIVFPNKNSLKQSVRVPMFRYVSSIAAAILIVALSGYFLTREFESTDNGTSTLTANLVGISIEENDTNEINSNLEIPDKRTNNVSQTNTSNNYIAETNSNSIDFGVPKRLPVKEIEKLEYKLAFSSTNIMEYRYDIPNEQNSGIEYTLEYKRTPKENKIVNGIKNIVNFGKEVDVIEKWENVKIRKEEFLYSSLDN